MSQTFFLLWFKHEKQKNSPEKNIYSVGFIKLKKKFSRENLFTLINTKIFFQGKKKVFFCFSPKKHFHLWKEILLKNFFSLGVEHKFLTFSSSWEKENHSVPKKEKENPHELWSTFFSLLCFMTWELPRIILLNFLHFFSICENTWENFISGQKTKKIFLLSSAQEEIILNYY